VKTAILTEKRRVLAQNAPPNAKNRQKWRFFFVYESLKLALPKLNLLLKRLPSSTIISLKIDKEDGILIYEGELRHNNKIYEFKIDAYSGVIIELEEDD
jgi:hypothetical protein